MGKKTVHFDTWRSRLKPGDTVYISFQGSCIKTTVSEIKECDILKAFGLWFIGGSCSVGDGIAYLMKESDEYLNKILTKFGPVTLEAGVTSASCMATASCSGKTYEAFLLPDAIKGLWDLLNDTIPSGYGDNDDCPF